MKIKQCILTKNKCYIKGDKISKVVGIVVHSTGSNNKNLKRYVQPLETDEDYAPIIADIGKNQYGNHWNRGGLLKKCVHAFIGVNAKGVVETYQTLPWDMCCWGCGSGKHGSYNYNPTAHIQFEICEDNLKDESYFKTTMKAAQELCAYLCEKFGLSSDTIVCHKEANRKGYANNHKDIEHWLKNFGKTMDWFRDEVSKILERNLEYVPTVKEWQDAAIADGYDFPKYGADGKWGNECEAVAKKAICKKQSRGYKNQNLTKIVQKVVGVDPDGKFGKNTEKAVVYYQNTHELSADGIVGSNTWKSMLKV